MKLFHNAFLTLAALFISFPSTLLPIQNFTHHYSKQKLLHQSNISPLLLSQGLKTKEKINQPIEKAIHEQYKIKEEINQSIEKAQSNIKDIKKDFQDIDRILKTIMITSFIGGALTVSIIINIAQKINK